MGLKAPYFVDILFNLSSIKEADYLTWDIEDVTWPRGDTRFRFSCWKVFHVYAAITHGKERTEFHISKQRPCNFFIIYILRFTH